MIERHITTDMIIKVKELMACGKSLVQVSAALGMSKARFNRLLTSDKEDSGLQSDLKDALDLGDTLHEAHFEEFYVDAMSGEVPGVKENLLKAYMQNKFKWSDKTETKEKKEQIQELSDAELQEKIDNLRHGTE